MSGAVYPVRLTDREVDYATGTLKKRSPQSDTDMAHDAPTSVLQEKHETPADQKEHGILALLFCAGGILVCYFYFGIIQEKITKSKYGADDERFQYTQALVMFLCVGNAIFAYGVKRLTGMGRDNTPTEKFALCAFTYLAAMIASNHALQFIPYPTQVLAKSCKPIPILIFGALFARKRYPLLKYLLVVMIVAGVALFLYNDKKAAPGKGKMADVASHYQLGWGELLLLISLTMDGCTGAVQDRIRAAHPVKSHNMMLQMNVWSTLYLLVGLILTGELMAFLLFVQRFPFVLVHLCTLALASALGQYFIFKTVSEFGPLPCSIVTTTRKFFTILASVVIFQNPMSGRQWLGTALVFLGLGIDAYVSSKNKSAKK